LNIVFYGAYGVGNIGDEATLEVLLERFRKAYPEVQKMVFSADPKSTAVIHSVKSSRPNLLTLLKSDILVVEDLDTSFKFLAGLFGRILRKRVVYYAVGAPNLTFLMKLLVPIALNVQDFSVRDSYSQEIFRGHGLRCPIKILPDPAIQLKPIEKIEAKKILMKENVNLGRFLVGLSSRYSRFEEVNFQLKQLLVSTLDWLIAEKNAEIVFIPMCKQTHGKLDKDQVFGEELKRLIRLPQHFTVLNDLNNPREVKGIFSLMNLCIGMRLHSAVFAYSVRTPYIGLVTGWKGYDEKIVFFMRRFLRKKPLLLGEVDAQLFKQEIIKLM
jgi:polysaccharide pyruvyl transferase WcaK-like protein